MVCFLSLTGFDCHRYDMLGCEPKIQGHSMR
jgi:hypothetical protein